MRFPISEINYWADRYIVNAEEVTIQEIILPKVKGLGYLDKDSFLTVCKWKSPRIQPLCKQNSSEFIRETTSLALDSAGEQLRINLLTLLVGVKWPTASVILHWFHKEEYPILDFRALWTLSVDVPNAYNFEFWQSYTEACRSLALQANVSMRTLDKALWQYSKENQ